jgi:hypothetical protein
MIYQDIGTKTLLIKHLKKLRPDYKIKDLQKLSYNVLKIIFNREKWKN